MASSAKNRVARVRRGDLLAIRDILTENSRKGGTLFAAGLTDAVLCHFEPFDEVVHKIPTTLTAAAAAGNRVDPTVAAALLNVLANLTCNEAPWVAAARKDIASKIAPLARVFIEGGTLYGSTEAHSQASPIFIALLANLVITVSMPELNRATKSDNGLRLKTYLASKMITCGDSPYRFPGEESIRRCCMQCFVEFFDFGDDPRKYDEKSRDQLGSLLKLEVPKISGGGLTSTLGEEFLLMLADPKTNLDTIEGALYVYGMALMGCPEVADSDGPGGFGLHSGMSNICIFFQTKVFSSGTLFNERADWATFGSRFFGQCLGGPTNMASDKRTAVFISSGAFGQMLSATTLFGDISSKEEHVAELFERMIGMIESVTSLKHTRAAVADLMLGTGGVTDKAIDDLVAAAKNSSKNRRVLFDVAKRVLNLRKRFVNAAGARVETGKPINLQGAAGVNGTCCARCFQPPIGTLKKCSKCTTKYCSRECQADDWKNGGHKAICKMKQNITSVKDFGREGKDLSAQGNEVISDRSDAMVVIACLQNWDILDCVLVIEFGAGTPCAQPVPKDRFISRYMSDECIGPDLATIEAQRAHTIAIIDRNRANGALTASCHSQTNSLLKTVNAESMIGFQNASGKELADNILDICNGDVRLARGPIAEALKDRGMLSGEDIAALVTNGGSWIPPSI
mmetsp:Transcript_40447/g.79700  ORF Transcript_40447/g.79700 Transcript_40447/m.79700 type:complete len:684 (-) Transcript_40447:104-2155(-)